MSSRKINWHYEVSNITDIFLCVRFHDPENFLKNAVIHYFWFINTVNYGQTPSVSITPVNQ